MLNPGEPLGWLAISGLEWNHMILVAWIQFATFVMPTISFSILQHSSSVTFALFGDTFYILVRDVFSDQSAWCN